MTAPARFVAGAIRVSLLPASERLFGLARTVIDGASGARLGPVERDRVTDWLEGDLDCLLDDAAHRGVTERAAGELLLAVSVLAWLRGGDPPGRGAAGFLEDHVALMNDAVHRDEKENQRAFRRTLEVLMRSEKDGIAAARWVGRDLDLEAVAERRRRRFGRKVDSTRRLRGLTIGELADRADTDVVSVIGFILGADYPDPEALQALAQALSLCPDELIPPDSKSADDGWVEDGLIGDLPDTQQTDDDLEERSEGGEVR